MKTLIYDIETAPTEAFVWRMWKENIAPSQVIEPGRVICWAAKWAGEKETFFGSEWGSPDFLVKLHELFNEADAVVTYNGSKFDEPVLNAAFVKEGFLPPPPNKHIDMYLVVRKRFKFLSNRLDYVCQHLGLQGKLATGGFDLWRDVVLNKDPAAQKRMERYNRRDVIILEKLYRKLLPWITNHPSHTHFDEKEGEHCPNCGSHKLQKRGMHRTKVSAFQRYQCQKCGTWSRKRVAEKTVKPEVVAI